MNSAQTNHIPQEAFDWYDEYAHGLIDRRTFIKKLGGLAALGFSMSVLTSALLPNYAVAEQVSFNDEDIKATYEEFDSPEGHGKGRGYLVVPQNNNNTNKKAKMPVEVVDLIRTL
jgi:carboxymethylenebutenolidase